MIFEMPPIRPPSEAHSLLIRATRNCPWNQCAFCGLYRGKKFSIRTPQEIKADILKAKETEQAILTAIQEQSQDLDLDHLSLAYGVPWVSRGPITAFIGDSNSIVMRNPDLVEVLRLLYEAFPNLSRVTSYGRASTILLKPLEDLIELRKAGLNRLHVGLETGDDFLLSLIKKGATADKMIAAGQKARQAGMELSEYVILGLGGSQWWRQHALGTARVLNAINPDFIRLRTLLIIDGTPLNEMAKARSFQMATPQEVLMEERLLIENLEVSSHLVSDHVSNYVSINGKLPDQKEAMLRRLDSVIALTKDHPDDAHRLLQPEILRRI